MPELFLEKRLRLLRALRGHERLEDEGDVAAIEVDTAPGGHQGPVGLEAARLDGLEQRDRQGLEVQGLGQGLAPGRLRGAPRGRARAWWGLGLHGRARLPWAHGPAGGNTEQTPVCRLK